MPLRVLPYIFLAAAILAVSCANQPGSKQQPGQTAVSSGDTVPSGQLQEIREASLKSESPVEDYESKGRLNRPDPDSTINAGRHNAITQAVRKVSPAVVSITVTEVVQVGQQLAWDQFFRPFLGEREYNSMGSGFIISEDGMVITNEHVANRNARRIVVSLPDGSQYEAEVVGTDELADLSLLKIQSDRSFPYVDFGNSDEVIVGEWSIAIGNPFGLFEAAQPSVTVGVISAINRDFRPNPNEPRVYVQMIQTDAAINRGNSGGPLVNSEGEVIGVNTFIYTGGTSGGFVGLSFAIPSNRVQKIIKQLATSGEVKLPFDLGIETREMTYSLLRQNPQLPPVPGLLVTSVNRDGPAFKGGIMPGDVIIKIGEERIQSKMHAQAIYREYDAGDSLHVELLRDKKRYRADIMLRPKSIDN